ncbi:MAG TPA: hypothetical protein VGJ15_08315, partial [Pirellulales bacterium]
QVYFRTHNLLTSGDGTPALKWGSTNAYTEDANGNPVYSWTILDRIFDTYINNGVRPYVQIGFMPEAMSTKPEPYQHHWTPTANYNQIYTGWSYPPKDFEKWQELAFQWAKHAVEKYGKDEVEKWYWEVWNEPNISYWRGTPQQFYELHDRAVAGVRKALPTARVGGPDKAGGGDQWFRDFLNHCVHGKNFATGETGTPLDFISFHAKGAPTFVEGHVRMGISNQLRAVDSGFKVIASFPELKDKPIVIGESDPDGCAACQGPQLGYRNNTMYSSYTAASFVRKLDLAARDGVNLEGALTWAFEFEDQPLFAGFRQMTTGGIDLPVLNVFRMFSKMSGDRVQAKSDKQIPLADIVRSGVRDVPDIGSMASLDGNKLCVFIWYYHDDDLSGPVADIDLSLAGLPDDAQAAISSGAAKLEHFRIDTDHSNAYTVWQKMGSPKQPTAEQYAELEKAGKLGQLQAADKLKMEAGQAKLHFNLPRQGISLVTIQWPGK